MASDSSGSTQPKVLRRKADVEPIRSRYRGEFDVAVVLIGPCRNALHMATALCLEQSDRRLRESLP